MKIERVPHEDAGTFVPGFPWRAVLHTTEGHSLPNYLGTAPHATLDLKHEIMYQHIDWFRAARSLRHPGGVETNRAFAVQFECIGFAADAAHWPDEYYQFIHRALVHAQHQGCDFKLLPPVPWDQARFSPDKWRRFNGVCGHRHVPGNDHTDPGAGFKSRKIK